jgi:hypothetical protein
MFPLTREAEPSAPLFPLDGCPMFAPAKPGHYMGRTRWGGAPSVILFRVQRSKGNKKLLSPASRTMRSQPVPPAPACRGTCRGGICGSAADLSCKCFFDRAVMGLRPTEGDEKRLGPATTLYEPSPSPLSSRAKPRDLRFRGPFLEMFFDRAQHSGEICGLPLSRCRSQERSTAPAQHLS